MRRPFTFLARLVPIFVLLGYTSELRADLQIDGVEGKLRDNIRLHLGLARESCDAPTWRVRQRFQQVEDQVAKALEGFGYYTPTVEKSLSFDDDCWNATVKVAPGFPVKIGQSDFEVVGEAKNNSEFLAIPTDAIKVGAFLDHQAYEQVKNQLTSLSSELGFFDFEFQRSRIDVWPEDGTAAIDIRFDSGDRYRFGSLSIQQDFLEPSLIRDYLPALEGEHYDSGKLSQIHQVLTASGYFAGIQVRPDIESRENGRVPIDLLLSPSQRVSYTVGGGFSTDTGPRFRGGYENRRLNTRGHQLNGELSVSEVISELTATYRRPLGRPDVEWLSYSAGVQVEDTDTSESDKFSLGLRRATLLGGDWVRSDSVSLQFDSFTVGSDRDNSRLVMPALGYSHKRSDLPVNPRWGHNFRVEVRGASDFLGSTTSFVQALASIKLVRPLGDKGRVLIRGEVGTTFQDDLNDLPPSVRFFAGGIDTVRGYGFETLGPVNDNDEVVGGSNLLAASVEYERRFLSNLAYAVFVDAGNAFDDVDLEARVGVGAGIKWFSPIGPFRFYIAHPTNFSDRSVRLHISLGPDL
ncbi:MAG: autotransporter assembly complex family protein [Pseudomonadota bacterium]